MPRLLPALALLVACKPAVSDHADTDLVEVSTRDPFPDRPTDPLAGSDVESCDRIDGTRRIATGCDVCAPYDPVAAAFPDASTIDPTLLRVWRYDRWYDAFHAPGGQTSDREMTQGFAPGTAEAVWGTRASFHAWDGFGDSAIWTGVATHAAMHRWRTTGTEADRLRFEHKVRVMLTQFEVTDVVGYLARAHFLIVPDGSPTSPDHLTLTATQADDVIRFEARDPSAAPDLPAAYTTGVTATDDSVLTGTIGWQGNPSIDQYTGAMVTLPAAWGLLDDPDLKHRIAAQLVGYLHRLQRVEIVNLQSNPDLAEAAAAVLAGAVQTGDDLDIASLDTIVLFALPAYNHRNDDTIERDPPEGLPVEPVLVLDAGDDAFLGELLGVSTRLAKGAPDGWDHVYAPSVRGGDAVHLLHLATMAWHMTGDDRYRAFLEDDLLATIDAASVANTLGSLVLPPWCRAYYGDHITLPPLWALINLVGPGPLRDELLRAQREEGWARIADGLGNAKFDLMIADHLDPGDPLRAELIAEAEALLTTLGGNGGVLEEPRRTYSLSYDDYTDALGDDFELRCPTPDERSRCEDGFDVLGLSIPGEEITHACFGDPLECDLGGGQCAWAVASEPLPMSLRAWEDFLWQRSPVKLGAAYGTPGAKSSPGLDLTESYWLGRANGMIDGPGLVLAWREDPSCGE